MKAKKTKKVYKTIGQLRAERRRLAWEFLKKETLRKLWKIKKIYKCFKNGFYCRSCN